MHVVSTLREHIFNGLIKNDHSCFLTLLLKIILVDFSYQNVEKQLIHKNYIESISLMEVVNIRELICSYISIVIDMKTHTLEVSVWKQKSCYHGLNEKTGEENPIKNPTISDQTLQITQMECFSCVDPYAISVHTLMNTQR